MSRTQIPLGDDDTEIEDVDLQLGLVNMACDFAAKTKMGPSMMSTSAWKYCPGCDMDKRHPDYGKPFSFLKHNDKCSNHKWQLTTLKSLLATLNHAWEDKSSFPTKKLRNAYLRSNGFRIKKQAGVPAIFILFVAP